MKNSSFTFKSSPLESLPVGRQGFRRGGCFVFTLSFVEGRVRVYILIGIVLKKSRAIPQQTNI
jgi:hypothetical protein